MPRSYPCPFHTGAGIPLGGLETARSVVLTWNTLSGGFTITAGAQTDSIKKKVDSVLEKADDVGSARELLRALAPGPPMPKPQDKRTTPSMMLEIINDMKNSNFGYQEAYHGDGLWAKMPVYQSVALTQREHPYFKSELHYFATYMWYFVQVYSFSACPELCQLTVGEGEQSRTVLPVNWQAKLLTDPKALVDGITIALRANRTAVLTGARADKYAHFMRGVMLSLTPSLTAEAESRENNIEESGAGSPDVPVTNLRASLTRLVMSESIWDAPRIQRAKSYLQGRKTQIAHEKSEGPEGPKYSKDDLALQRMLDYLGDMTAPLMKDAGRFRVRGEQKDVRFGEFQDTNLRTVLCCILSSLFDGHMYIPELNTIQDSDVHISADEINKKFPCRLPTDTFEGHSGLKGVWARQLGLYHVPQPPMDPTLVQQPVRKVPVDQTLLRQYLTAVQSQGRKELWSQANAQNVHQRIAATLDPVKYPHGGLTRFLDMCDKIISFITQPRCREIPPGTSTNGAANGPSTGKKRKEREEKQVGEHAALTCDQDTETGPRGPTMHIDTIISAADSQTTFGEQAAQCLLQQVEKQTLLFGVVVEGWTGGSPPNQLSLWAGPKHLQKPGGASLLVVKYTYDGRSPAIVGICAAMSHDAKEIWFKCPEKWEQYPQYLFSESHLCYLPCSVSARQDTGSERCRASQDPDFGIKVQNMSGAQFSVDLKAWNSTIQKCANECHRLLAQGLDPLSAWPKSANKNAERDEAKSQSSLSLSPTTRPHIHWDQLFERAQETAYLPEQMQVGWVQQELGRLILDFYTPQRDAPVDKPEQKKYNVHYQYLDYAIASVSLQPSLPSWYMNLAATTPVPDGFSVFAAIGKHILCSPLRDKILLKLSLSLASQAARVARFVHIRNSLVHVLYQYFCTSFQAAGIEIFGLWNKWCHSKVSSSGETSRAVSNQIFPLFSHLLTKLVHESQDGEKNCIIGLLIVTSPAERRFRASSSSEHSKGKMRLYLPNSDDSVLKDVNNLQNLRIVVVMESHVLYTAASGGGREHLHYTSMMHSNNQSAGADGNQEVWVTSGMGLLAHLPLWMLVPIAKYLQDTPTFENIQELYGTKDWKAYADMSRSDLVEVYCGKDPFGNCTTGASYIEESNFTTYCEYLGMDLFHDPNTQPTMIVDSNKLEMLAPVISGLAAPSENIPLAQLVCMPFSAYILNGHGEDSDNQALRDFYSSIPGRETNIELVYHVNQKQSFQLRLRSLMDNEAMIGSEVMDAILCLWTNEIGAVMVSPEVRSHTHTLTHTHTPGHTHAL